jgi:hypothetical protein
VWAIIKREIHGMLVTREIPGVTRENLLYQPGRFYKEAVHALQR